MSDPQLELSAADNRLRVSGELNFNNVPAFVSKAQDYFKNGSR